MKQTTAEALIKLLRAMDHHPLTGTVDTFFATLPTSTMSELEAISRGSAPSAAPAQKMLATGCRWKPKGEDAKWQILLSREPTAEERAAWVIEPISIVAGHLQKAG